MANFDSVKKGNGPTVIGAPKNGPLISNHSVSSTPTQPSQQVVATQEAPKLALPPRPSISQKIDNTINTIPLPLPPKPIHESTSAEKKVSEGVQPVIIKAAPITPPSPSRSAYNQLPPLPPKPIQKNNKQTESELVSQPALTSESENNNSKQNSLPLPSVSDTARSLFLGLDKTQTSNAYTGVPANIIQSIALNGADSVTSQTPSADFKIKKPRSSLRNLPIAFAALTLVFSLAAAGVTWYLNYSSTPHTQASTQSSVQTTGNVAITTYLSNSAVESDKKEQTAFLVSDPIQICIRYEQQQTNTAMQIKLLREVDGGSQLEITSARINASGTDTRCLPFTGVQAKEGKYTVEVSTAPDSTSAFKKVADSKFTITQKAE